MKIKTSMKTLIKDLQALFNVWEQIEYEIDDSEEKATAQKIIDRLIISTAQDISESYSETEDRN